eukprot:gnl/MRDRNA2_/MRDRNA2_116110_c0_seq1.p1 gnl/MRDRNA2_/MRDRNA2_116110_c0~~gnl/MRDRNA2_/MRDRNA2_116110_c0_seq1.p1  ORF type:complete len:317 (-),score=46.43 gnl/MRDRNA2_/MRDRNA2_116110_c0_seq1:129-1079(-)
MIQSVSEGTLQLGIAGVHDEVPSSAPLVVRMTKTARTRKALGHDRRFSTKHSPFSLFEENMVTKPRPPSDLRPISSHSCPAPVTAKRQAHLREVEALGKEAWGGAAAKEPQQKNTEVPTTWSAAMRAALAHSRRAAAQIGLDVPTGAFNTAHSDLRGPPSAKGPPPGRPAHSSHTRRIPQSPSLQDARGHSNNASSSMLMKGWARRCFADAGLGIGERFPTPAHAFFPGPGAYGNEYGNVALWNADKFLPSKQPCGKHVSAETHRCGVRREPSERESGPGPGYYDQPTFVEEMLSKEEHALRPRTMQMPSSWCSIP